MTAKEAITRVMSTQETLKATFQNVPQAESFMVQLRRFKTKYPNGYVCTRQGSTVLIGPTGSMLLPPTTKPVFEAFAAAGNEDLERAKLRVEIIKAHYTDGRSMQDTVDDLVFNQCADNEEEAKKMVEVYRGV